MAQDRDGVVWIGNSEGLLRFDGARWRRLALPGETVRSIDIGPDGRVYVGGVGTIGYVGSDRAGVARYVPLFAGESIRGEDVWSTLTVGRDVFFQTFSRLYRFDGARLVEVGRTTAALRFHKAFEVQDVDGVEHLYVRQEGVGLSRYDPAAQRLVLVDGGGEYADEKIRALFGHRLGGLLVVTDGGLEVLREGAVAGIRSPHLEEVIATSRVYEGIALGNSLYALGTLGGGVLIVDDMGSLIQRLGDAAGLASDDLVIDLSTDFQGGLWLALGDGLVRYDALGPVTTFDERLGLPGAVYSVERLGSTLFAATEVGLFRLEATGIAGETPAFVPTGIREQVWGLVQTRGRILAATNAGVFELGARGTPRLVLRGRAHALRLAQDESGGVLVGTDNGLIELTMAGSDWHPTTRLADVGGAVLNIAVDPAGSVWVATYDSVVVIDPGRATPVRRYGLPGASIGLLDGIVIVTNDAIRRPSPEGALVGDSELTRLVREGDTTRTLAWSTDLEGRFWVSRGGLIRAFQHLPKGWDDVTPTALRTLRDGLRTVFVDEDALWLGTESGLVRYDLDSRGESRYAVAPRVQVARVIGSQSGIIWGGGSPQGPRLSRFQVTSTSGPLRFEFVTPAFNDASATRYRTRLIGMDDRWTDWSHEPWREYTNLAPGDYQFQVQSVTAQGVNAATRSVAFEIAPRWFETWLARLALAFVVLGLVVAIANHRVRIHEKRAQIERDRANELGLMNEQLQEADRLKDQMLANTSHELRTPLTAILGYADLLTEYTTEEPASEVRETAGHILAGAHRLFRTVEDMMDAASIRAGKVELFPEEVDITSVVRSVVEQYRGVARDKGLDLIALPGRPLAYGSPTEVQVDRRAITRIMDHLIDNAVKFTDEGMVTVELEIGEDPQFVSVTVADTGRGIDASFVPHLFEAFKQQSTGFARTHEGNGLGLSIVGGLAGLMGMRLSVESTLHKGTEIKITLPVRSPAAREVDVPRVQSTDTSAELGPAQVEPAHVDA